MRLSGTTWEARDSGPLDEVLHHTFAMGRTFHEQLPGQNEALSLKYARGVEEAVRDQSYGSDRLRFALFDCRIGMEFEMGRAFQRRSAVQLWLSANER